MSRASLSPLFLNNREALPASSHSKSPGCREFSRPFSPKAATASSATINSGRSGSPEGGALVWQNANEGQVRLGGLKLGLLHMRCGQRGRWRAWAVQRQGGDHGRAEIARALLREKKLDGDVAVRGDAIDGSRVHVAAGLKPQLAFPQFLMHVRFAGSAHGDLRVAQHDADRIGIMPVQENGIVRRDFDLIDVHIGVPKRKMMMRLGGQRDAWRWLG